MIRARRQQLEHAERRAAEAEEDAGRVRGELARLRAAIDVLPVGVILADAGGEVIFRNRYATALAESRQADVLAAAAADELLRGDLPRSESLELHGPPRRVLHVTAERLEGSPDGATLAVIRDVTERRQLDAVRRDFVANVSHELRTPIGALSVLAEALAAEEDPAVVRRLVSRISTEVDRASAVIQDLLDLSRIEAEGLSEPAPVSISAVIGAAVDRVRAVSGQRRVDVAVGDVPALAVLGDEDQLVSAVTNLLDNAVKYSDPGSAVDVEATDNGHWVDVVVRDRGIGIPARDLGRIFERFYRVDRARSRQTGGTGLGLSIVRHVAENHGGQVLVESREGEGSAFTLRLPRRPP
ncbi:MAG TPA: ATP-binding protein [Acidimicrobiales bacterium]|nr:ATP-binding protein [Acidimicrobiales bacterium]